jgi:ribose transport system substrate-binding protein
MLKTKKSSIFALYIFLCFSMGLAGCQPKPAESIPFIATASVETEAVTQSPDSPTIALVMKTLTNPFFVQMEKGARQAEAELGIQLIVKTAAEETSIQQQIEIVEELIKLKVDAIVIAPGDSSELIPVLKKAQDAGIIVVNIDNRLNPEVSRKVGLENVPFISVDNEEGAYQSAQYVARKINQPTKAVIIEGIVEAQNALDRKNGALRAFRKNVNINVVAVESANWKIDEAYNVTKSLFEKYPDIGLIYCANDMMALGAIQYLQDFSIKNVLVVGFDNLEEAQLALSTGALQATVDQQASVQGYTGVQYAVKLLQGEQVPAETLVDTQLITAIKQ